jgi:SAM-dependent methyltransferase
VNSHKEELLYEVSNYYSDKLKRYGTSPLGVDWNGEESQKLRFNQLVKVITETEDYFSINDLGCGYGALLDFLSEHYNFFNYQGIDISSRMIEAATKRSAKSNDVHFLNSCKPDRIANFSIASGIFNVKLSKSNKEWKDYILNTLDILNGSSSSGFSFNCLTSYSDKEKMRKDLYYGDPCEFFDLCKRKYSKEVSLLHDYGLFEFTIVVKK